MSAANAATEAKRIEKKNEVKEMDFQS